MPPEISIQQAFDQIDEYLKWLIDRGVYTKEQAKVIRANFERDLESGLPDAFGNPRPFYEHDIYKQASSYLKQKAEGEEPTTVSVSIPGQEPQFVIVPKRAVASVNEYVQHAKAAQEYNALIAKQKEEAEVYEKKYGFQPARQIAGQDQTFTSAAAIEEQQRLQEKQRPYLEEYEAWKAKQTATTTEKPVRDVAELQFAQHTQTVEARDRFLQQARSLGINTTPYETSLSSAAQVQQLARMIDDVRGQRRKTLSEDLAKQYPEAFTAYQQEMARGFPNIGVDVAQFTPGFYNWATAQEGENVTLTPAQKAFQAKRKSEENTALEDFTRRNPGAAWSAALQQYNPYARIMSAREASAATKQNVLPMRSEADEPWYREYNKLASQYLGSQRTYQPRARWI